MISKKGKCNCCNRDNMTLPAKGLYGKCYDEIYPKHLRRKTKRYNHNKPNNGEYPKVEMIKVYVCSDGTEFSGEVDALRHQLELERERK